MFSQTGLKVIFGYFCCCCCCCCLYFHWLGNEDSTTHNLYSCAGDGSVLQHRTGHFMDDPVDVNALILKTNNLKVQCENLLQAFSIKMWIVESRYKTDLTLAATEYKVFLSRCVSVMYCLRNAYLVLANDIHS